MERESETKKIEAISEEDPSKIKKILPLIIVAVIVIAIIIIYPILTKSEGEITNKRPSTNTGSNNQQFRTKVNVTEVTPQHIDSLLNQMGASNLHNPPLSKDTPKIKTVVDARIFSSEVKKKIVTTAESDVEKPDIIIRADKETFLWVINSADVKSAIVDNVNSGKIQIDMVASKTKLFLKGYLSLYKEISGEEIE